MIKNIITILILVCTSAYAQKSVLNNDSIKIKKILEEVVITGQIKEVNIDNALHDINIIGLETIKKGGFTSLNEILKFQSNIQISNDNILGSQINIQGITGENIKILIDGKPMIGRLNGNIDLSQVNLMNIKRIEIVEGPLSVNYGSDALGGTINIITKKSNDILPAFESYYETIGKYNNSIVLNQEYQNQNITYFFSRKYFNGWSKDDDYTFLPQIEFADTNRFKKWKPKEQVINKLEHNITHNQLNIRSYYEHFYEKITNRGFPFESTAFATAFDDYYFTYRKDFGTEINTKKWSHRINIIGGHNNYRRIKNTYLKNLTTLSQSILPDASAQDTSILNLMFLKATASSDKNNKINYQFGLDLNEENANGKKIIANQQNQSDYAFFSNLQLNLNEKVTIRQGLRLIYNNRYEAPIVPATNVLIKHKKNQLRFSYAKGFRAPSLKELFFEFIDINHNIVGNKNLNAETSDNYRISFRKDLLFDKNILNFKVSSFYNKIANKISLSNVDDQYSYFNVAEFKSMGINLKSNILINKLKFNNTISYTGISNELYENYNNHTDFTFFIETSNSVSANIYEEFQLNIYHKYVGSSPSFTELNNDIIETEIDSYQLIDFSLNTKISAKIFITLGCKNLLNVIDINSSSQNSTHSGGNGYVSINYGRTYFTNLKIHL